MIWLFYYLEFEVRHLFPEGVEEYMPGGKGWIANGWRKRDGAAVVNKDELEELDQVMQGYLVKMVSD